MEMNQSQDWGQSMSWRLTRTRWLCARVVLLLLAMLVSSVYAQQTITSAALSGRVEDATGAVVKDACVTARNVETNSTHMCNCDSSGSFRFSYMTVGRYELSVASPGFAELKRQVTLTIGQALEVSLKLAVAGVNETVEVAADLPSLETVRTQQAERLLSREIDSLPLNGRNYLDLAALTPGVTRSNPVANQRFPETSAVPGTGVSITGQRFINNGFVIDVFRPTMMQLICRERSTARKRFASLRLSLLAGARNLGVRPAASLTSLRNLAPILFAAVSTVSFATSASMRAIR
jgi:hypothetical protein